MDEIEYKKELIMRLSENPYFVKWAELKEIMVKGQFIENIIMEEKKFIDEKVKLHERPRSSHQKLNDEEFYELQRQKAERMREVRMGNLEQRRQQQSQQQSRQGQNLQQPREEQYYQEDNNPNVAYSEDFESFNDESVEGGNLPEEEYPEDANVMDRQMHQQQQQYRQYQQATGVSQRPMQRVPVSMMQKNVSPQQQRRQDDRPEPSVNQRPKNGDDKGFFSYSKDEVGIGDDVSFEGLPEFDDDNPNSAK